MENPYFEKLAVMWICGGFAPRGPSALLATKKSWFGIKTCHLAIPRIMGQKNADLKNRFFNLYGSKSGILNQKTVFWGVLDWVWGSRPETKTENNRNGPQKQDPIVGITHRWPWRCPGLHHWIWPLYPWIWPYLPWISQFFEVRVFHPTQAAFCHPGAAETAQ